MIAFSHKLYVDQWLQIKPPFVLFIHNVGVKPIHINQEHSNGVNGKTSKGKRNKARMHEFRKIWRKVAIFSSSESALFFHHHVHAHTPHTRAYPPFVSIPPHIGFIDTMAKSKKEDKKSKAVTTPKV